MTSSNQLFHIVHFSRIGVYDFDVCAWRFYTGYAMVSWDGNILQSLMVETAAEDGTFQHAVDHSVAVRRALDAGWISSPPKGSVLRLGAENA